MSSEQSPDERAREEMNAYGVPDEVILTRAILMGAVFRPHGPETDTWGQVVNLIVAVPEDFEQPDKGYSIIGLVGSNQYTLAWRWLKVCYPQVLTR